MNKKNIIMIIAIIVVVIAIGIIVFRKNSDNKTTSNSNNTVATQKNSSNNTESTERKAIDLEADESGNIVIDTTNIGSKASFYNYDADGTTIRLFAVKASDGTIRMACNTCQVCNPSPKAYFVQNGKTLFVKIVKIHLQQII